MQRREKPGTAGHGFSEYLKPALRNNEDQWGGLLFLVPEVFIPDLTCSPPLSTYDAFSGPLAFPDGHICLSQGVSLAVEGSLVLPVGPRGGRIQGESSRSRREGELGHPSNQS